MLLHVGAVDLVGPADAPVAFQDAAQVAVRQHDDAPVHCEL